MTLDVDALRAKYREERAKRLRDEVRKRPLLEIQGQR